MKFHELKAVLQAAKAEDIVAALLEIADQNKLDYILEELEEVCMEDYNEY